MSEGSDDFDYKTDSDLLALDDYALGELGDESPMAPARKVCLYSCICGFKGTRPEACRGWIYIKCSTMR